MAELTQEEKIKSFEKLPKELQNFMASEDTGAFLLYLGEKYNLDDEKISMLSKIVGDVILGIMPVTSLAQEINLKITADHQIAMNLTQELYANLFSPVMAMLSKPAAPAAPTTSAPQPKPTPIPSVPPTQIPNTKYQIPPSDRYRESPTGPARQRPEPQAMAGGPEIVDLRKAPPPLPILSPTPSEQQNLGSSISQPNLKDLGEIGTKPLTPPLTFTRPIEPPVVSPSTSLGASKVEPPKSVPKPIPLIEAEPHLPTKVSPEISAGKIAPPPPTPKPQIPATSYQLPATENRPQYIIRPPGLAPTDLPRDILDLRRDKGEF